VFEEPLLGRSMAQRL